MDPEVSLPEIAGTAGTVFLYCHGPMEHTDSHSGRQHPSGILRVYGRFGPAATAATPIADACVLRTNCFIRSGSFNTGSCSIYSLNSDNNLPWWLSCLDRGALINADAPGCGTSMVRGLKGHK